MNLQLSLSHHYYVGYIYCLKKESLIERLEASNFSSLMKVQLGTITFNEDVFNQLFWVSSDFYIFKKQGHRYCELSTGILVPRLLLKRGETAVWEGGCDIPIPQISYRYFTDCLFGVISPKGMGTRELERIVLDPFWKGFLESYLKKGIKERQEFLSHLTEAEQEMQQLIHHKERLLHDSSYGRYSHL